LADWNARSCAKPDGPAPITATLLFIRPLRVVATNGHAAGCLTGSDIQRVFGFPF
jgi:hypothetical protein